MSFGTETASRVWQAELVVATPPCVRGHAHTTRRRGRAGVSRTERTLTLLQATRGRDPYNVIGEFGGGGLVVCACEVGVVVDVMLVGMVSSSVLPAVACQTYAGDDQHAQATSRPRSPIFNSGLACHVLILRVWSWAQVGRLIHGCCFQGGLALICSPRAPRRTSSARPERCAARR
jgi:hypothetical protein